MNFVMNFAMNSKASCKMWLRSLWAKPSRQLAYLAQSSTSPQRFGPTGSLKGLQRSESSA